MHEEEQLHEEEKTGSDALQQTGEVLGQSAQSAMDVEVLCMAHLRKSSDTRDSSFEVLCTDQFTLCLTYSFWTNCFRNLFFNFFWLLHLFLFLGPWWF